MDSLVEPCVEEFVCRDDDLLPSSPDSLVASPLLTPLSATSSVEGSSPDVSPVSSPSSGPMRSFVAPPTMSDGYKDPSIQLLQGYKDPPAGLRRRRHNLTPAQSRVLEDEFRANPRPGRKSRIEISNLILLDIDKVRKWFENRRNKYKRTVEKAQQMAMCPAIPDGALSPGDTIDSAAKVMSLLRHASTISTDSKGKFEPASMRPDCNQRKIRAPGSTLDEAPIIKAHCVRGDDVGAMVAPLIAQFVNAMSCEIRLRAESCPDTTAAMIMHAQSSLRTNVERLFSTVRYDSRTVLSKEYSSCDACSFAFFIPSGNVTTPYHEVRIDGVTETQSGIIHRLVLHVHVPSSANEFKVGCKLMRNQGGVAWGDLSRLKSELFVGAFNDGDLWRVLIFLVLGRTDIPDMWLSDLIASL